MLDHNHYCNYGVALVVTILGYKIRPFLSTKHDWDEFCNYKFRRSKEYNCSDFGTLVCGVI